mmetsp:Transcript_138690/g.276563  ORF Transcript_138690/g.276563 Transcript_138690/m.276563 type:complete len:328 (+) Transcript_138690:667-1650(+)
MPFIKKAASADCSVRAIGEPIAHPPPLVRCHYARDAIGTSMHVVSVVANRERTTSSQDYRPKPLSFISQITEDEVETRLEQLGSGSSHSEHTVQGSADVSCASLEQSQDVPQSLSGSGSAQQEEERKTEHPGLHSIKEGETHMDREAKLLQRREEREKLRKLREAEKSSLGPDDLRDCTFRPVLCRDRKKHTRIGRTSPAVPSPVSMTSRPGCPSKGKPLADRQCTALHSLRVLATDEALLRKKLAAMQAEIQERFQEADQLRAQRAALVEELEAVEEEAADLLGNDHWKQAAKGVEFGLAKVARRSLPAGPALSQTSTASSAGEAF